MMYFSFSNYVVEETKSPEHEAPKENTPQPVIEEYE
jgi:hypothetical protein